MATTSLSNTPQAGDDIYNFTEDELLSSDLLSGNILTLDVMSDDLGGNAKKLFSIDDGGTNTFLNDLMTNNVTTGWELTANGNLIRIYNGKIEFDITNSLIAANGAANANVNALSAGETITDSFVYAIQLGNGTLSWATVTFSLTGENDAPTDITLNNSSINENAAGEVIGTLSTTDADSGETFTYTLDDNRFEVVNGELKLKDGESLNYESEQTVTIEVTSTDGSNASVTTQFVINVNDVNEQPSAGADFAVSAAENVNDTTVLATVTGTDPDTGGGNDGANNFENLSYAIAPGGDLSGKFEINGAGQISLISGQSLDFETAQSHVVTVRVSDGPGLFDEVAVTINVTDVNEAPVAPADFATSAAENVNDTTILATVTGTEPDTGGGNDGANDFENLSYAIAPGGDLSGKFEINSAGQISLISGQSLDFETAQSHVVTVRVSDGPGLFDDVAVTINVTDVAEGAPSIDLSTLDSTSGFRLDGAAAYDRAGISVSAAGDVNGDGFDDLIVGAPLADPGGNVSGAAYVVFGKAGGFDSTVDLSTLDGTSGFRLDGAAALDLAGYSVSAAGDVNGDGLDDLIVGARGAHPGGFSSGAAYVVFGKAGGFASTVDLSTLDSTSGFRLDGAAAFDYAGVSVSAAGDVNGDGFDDLIVGAHRADPGGNYSGAAYVVFGKAGGFASTVDLSTLDGTTGFRLDGAAGFDQAGISVSAAGDVNGDGFDDLIVGTYSADPGGSQSGAAYVVFGKAGGFDSTVDLSTLDGTSGFRLDGAATYDQAGISVSAAGDVNGDGFDDLIVGARGADPGGSNSGAAYVVFGKAGGFASDVDLSTLDGTSGFRLDGATENGQAGWSVSAAGDVNGDGFDDLIVGARGAHPGGFSSGAAYVVFGKAGGFASDVDLSTLDGMNGFRLDGAAPFDNAGVSVSAAGDVNGDGFSDLIVGADFADPGGSLSGAAYVVFGGNFNGAVTHLGTSGADALAGTAAAETFVSGQGDDTLTGGGGEDAFQGGAGDDLIVVSDALFHRIDGGGGENDVLRFDFVGTIDLGDLDGNAATSERGAIAGIETLDLTNGLANTLQLGIEEILDLGVRATDVNGEAAIDNALQILGEAGDSVDLQGAWTDNGADSGGTGFHLFTTTIAGDAVKILIDSDVFVI